MTMRAIWPTRVANAPRAARVPRDGGGGPTDPVSGVTGTSISDAPLTGIPRILDDLGRPLVHLTHDGLECRKPAHARSTRARPGSRAARPATPVGSAPSAGGYRG